MKLIALTFSLLIYFPFLSAQTDFSQENAHELLKYLSVDIGPRPMGSPAEQQALHFAAEKFQEYGCDTVYIMKIDRFSRGNTNTGVAVGIKRGITKRVIVIGGHIDSASPEVPGTNDDGSGSAVVMEVARVFGKRQMQSTSVFCCFGGEEQGLVGSKHFVTNFTDIDSVVQMLQVDMANGLGILDFAPDAYGSLSAPKWLVKATYEEYNKLAYTNLSYPTHFFSLNYSLPQGASSDHEPFLQIGIPAIAFVTDVAYPIHSPADNFENFEPAGLKRTGDLIVKLVERFDSGTPNRVLEWYWLWAVFGFPIFITHWGLWSFIVIVVGLTITAFFTVRKRRELTDPLTRIRWSGSKLFLFSFIIVVCGWFSSDLIGWIKGVRYPWIPAIECYYLFALIALFIGGSIAIRLSKKIRISQCPYLLFKRAVIMLLVFLIGLGIFNFKLIVEPGVALFFISLAMLVRQPLLKLFFIVLSPWWMIRLIFSEWSELFFRMSTDLPLTTSMKLMLNFGAVILISIYILPFLLALTSVLRDTPALRCLITTLRTKTTFIIFIILFIGMGIYLLFIPRFNKLWYHTIDIEQEYDMNSSSKSITIKSSEYLNNLKFTHAGGDTMINANKSEIKMQPPVAFDTTWVNLKRHEQKHQFSDTTHYDIELTLSTKFRPYTISISYSIDGKSLNAFSTPLQFRTDEFKRKIEWYSYPDSILSIPVQFSTIGKESVQETIEVVFDKLAYPIEVSGDRTYTIPRTKYVTSFDYE
ncbi:MAG: M28 family metallopeptidase [Bacteroidota bacterium]|nr:M28 family metallopeptidase [Bacteroidota bacterium]